MKLPDIYLSATPRKRLSKSLLGHTLFNKILDNVSHNLDTVYRAYLSSLSVFRFSIRRLSLWHL